MAFYFLMVSSIVAVVVLMVWALKLESEDNRVTPGLSLILGGALGNLGDRIRLQEVIDFLDLYIGTYHWPAFNVADMAITVGALWVAYALLIQRSAKN